MLRRAILLGIDEAGYGPLLGPLVVSAVAFEVPAHLADASLWGLLRGSVADTPRPRDRRLPIVDSKKLYHRKDGLARLERSALAALACWRGLPPDLPSLLRLVAPALLPQLDAYPWYRQTRLALPLAADEPATRLAAGRLRSDAAASGLSLAGVFCEPLLEAHYNRLVSSTRNKAVVLFGLTSRLMQRAADAFPDRPLHVFADKQGARGRYGRMLMRAFDDRRLVVLEETDATSAYELRSAAAPWRIRFSQGGESQHLPVALASIISKYLRELFMTAFNDWWRGRLPHVAATAGYYQDGLRFINDVRPHLPRLGVALEQLVRQQ